MSVVIGTMNNGKGPILEETTPAYQVDEATTGTKYMRYEDTTEEQFIKRIVVDASITTITVAFDTWANRATATYRAINR